LERALPWKKVSFFSNNSLLEMSPPLKRMLYRVPRKITAGFAAFHHAFAW
jgi:hypothetical protein